MAASDNTPKPPDRARNGIDQKEVRKESAKAAQKAREAQKQAHELREAAHGAADPEERQKLLEQAIDKLIEAESFGKMAKYMRTGTFQGMAVGAGIGVVPGLTLGTLTGVLVGALVSTITGGLGAAAGAIAGAIHGPFWNLGEAAGKGIRKITGDIPGWKATDKQKWTLEKMLGQAKEQDMPTDEELDFLKQDDGTSDWGAWVEDASSRLTTMPSWAKPGQGPGGSHSARKYGESRPTPAPASSQASQGVEQMYASAARAPQSASPLHEKRKPRKLEVRAESQDRMRTGTSPVERRQPRKLERRA